MSLEKAESYLKEAGFLDHVIELKESTATVALAADCYIDTVVLVKTFVFDGNDLDDCENDVLFTGRTAGIDFDRRYCESG